MALFKRQNPFSIRKGYVLTGEPIFCEICGRSLDIGAYYVDAHPRCSDCYDPYLY